MTRTFAFFLHSFRAYSKSKLPVVQRFILLKDRIFVNVHPPHSPRSENREANCDALYVAHVADGGLNVRVRYRINKGRIEGDEA